MELVKLIFSLGIVFAIFGFIWAIIEMGLKLLTSGQSRTLIEVYTIKGLKYLLLVNVTFLFSLNEQDDDFSINQLAITGLILLMYFIGKLQRNKNQRIAFEFMGQLTEQVPIFNLQAEIAIIGISVGLFILFIFQPSIAHNALALWFQSSVSSIEKTPLIGFIFQIIGFFFLVNILTKMLNSIYFLLTGKPFIQTIATFQKNQKKEDDFDDFEEVT